MGYSFVTATGASVLGCGRSRKASSRKVRVVSTWGKSAPGSQLRCPCTTPLNAQFADDDPGLAQGAGEGAGGGPQVVVLTLH